MTFKKSISSIAVCIVFLLQVACLKEKSLPIQKLWYNQPVKSLMTEVLPIGNGFLGACDEGRELLENTRFQKIHQRYVRKELWKKLCQKLEMKLMEPSRNPGDDALAFFGIQDL